MFDEIFQDYLKAQHEEILALAEDSDLLCVAPEPVPLPQRYVCQFSCKGLVKDGPGEPREADHFVVGIQFHDGFLHRVDPARVATVLHPLSVYHPNIMLSAICCGKLIPGMSGVELIYQIFEILSYHRWTANDALNREAAQWVRNQVAEGGENPFPLEQRPLRRRRDTGGDAGEKGGESC